MRETNFIDQNKDKWLELEGMLEGQRKDPERMRELFVQVTDDLSFSRTFYPNRSVRVYLNSLAQRLFLQLYKRRVGRGGRLLRFWVDELPLLIHESRSAFRLSFFVFVLATAIGILSCAMDAEFVSVVLGDSYVEMTRANIESGDPMAVYKERGQYDMFLSITFNNIFVAFKTFIMGILLGVGSIIFLIANGVMLGAFQWFFVEEGLFWESFLTIWIHGTLEISAIIIAGAAGITMGRGIAFPGTYTRLQAFQRSARRGLKIMIGTTPLFLLAGFFEGYLTRQTETPDAVRVVFILLCLFVVLFYFVWYPWYRAKHLPQEGIRGFELPPDRTRSESLHQIRGAGEVFSKIFTVVKMNSGQVLPIIAGSALLYCLVAFLPSGQAPTTVVSFEGAYTKLNMMGFLFGGGEYAWLLRLAHGLSLALLALFAFRWVYRLESGKSMSQKQLLKHIPLILFPITVLTFAVGLYHWSVLLLFFLVPIFLLWGYAAFRSGKVFPALGESRSLFVAQSGSPIGLLSMLFLLGLLAFFLFDSLAFGILNMGLGWVVRFEGDKMWEFRHLFKVFCMISLTNAVWLLLFIGTGLQYYSLREIKHAEALRERIKSIGQHRFIRGLERE